MKGVHRVLLVDADSLTPEPVGMLASPSDYAIVAGNCNQSMQRWRVLEDKVKRLQIQEVPSSVKQAADLALAFAAGEAVATYPALKHCPWLVVSHDRDMEAIIGMLCQRGVANVMQVGIRKPKTPIKALPTKQAKKTMPPVPTALHRAILSKEGYPFSLSQIPALIQSGVLGNSEKIVMKHFGSHKGVRKAVVALGFPCDAQYVLKSPA